MASAYNRYERNVFIKLWFVSKVKVSSFEICVDYLSVIEPVLDVISELYADIFTVWSLSLKLPFYKQ